MLLLHWLRQAMRSRCRRTGQRPAPRRSSSARPRVESLEDRLAPAASVTASATSNLLNKPVQFSLYDNGYLVMTRGTVHVTVASGVQGLFQGTDGAGDQVAYDLVGHVLREYTPNHGWVAIGSADQAAGASGHVYFRQAGNLFLTTGAPASSASAYQAIANTGVSALVQFDASHVLFLQNGTFYYLSGSTQPTKLESNVKALVQDGPGQVLFLDGGNGLNLLSPSTGDPQPLLLDVQGLAQSAPNTAVYLTADGTLMSTTTGSTPTAIATSVQALAEGRNETAYVIHNGMVAEVTAAGKLVNVPGTANTAHLIVDGQQQVYAISTRATLERITGLSAKAIAWNVTSYAIDSAGELVELDGPAVYHYYTGQYTISGISTAVQFALDASGDLYSIDRNGNLAMAATSSSPLQQIATGVTQVAIDSAGDLVYLTGPYMVNYVSGGLFTSNSTAGTNGNPPPARFALDLEGNLYTLDGGVLTVTATSDPSTSQRLATGVLGMAADSAGQVVAVTGPHSYAYYGGLVGGGGSSNIAQYAVDPAGVLYALYPSGALYAAATAATPMHLVETGVTRMAMDIANEVVLLHGTSSYDYLLGQLGTGGSGSRTTYAIDSHGDLYTLSANTVTMSSWSLGTTRTLGTGVSQMFMDKSGEVALLFGTTGQLSYYDSVGQKFMPILANQAQAVVDSHGRLYSRGASGVVSQIAPQGPVPVDYLAKSIGISNGNAYATYTTIGQFWHNLAAVHTQMGLPTGPEVEVAGGRAVEFQGGEMTWSPQTGVRVIPVEFRRTYDNLNGPSSYLGFPTTGLYLTHDITGTVDGEVLYFQNGALFMSNTGVITAVSKHIAQAYQQYQSGNFALGVPSSAQAIPATDTEAVTFTDGVLYWSPATGTRLAADASTLNKLSMPALSLAGGGITGQVINNTLNQQFGVQFSATGTFSMNLADETAYASVDFAGLQLDSGQIESLLNLQPELPSLPNPLDILTSLGRTGVSNGYAKLENTDYGPGATNAANVYVSSSQFVDWASPDTVGELIGATALGAGDLAYNTLVEHLSEELQGIIAWATRRWGDEPTALAQLSLALVQGRLNVTPVAVPYYYTLFGQQLPPEYHLGFVLSVTPSSSNPLPTGPLMPQPDLIGTATSAASALDGVSADNIQSILGQFAVYVVNHALGTNIDASAINLGESIGTDLVTQGLYRAAFTELSKFGLSASTLTQLYTAQGDSALLNLNQGSNSIGQQLQSEVNHYLGGDLKFVVTYMTFNTSTYELAAQIQVNYAHNWGTLGSILDNVGNTLWNLGKGAVQHIDDWFQEETGFLANWWQNTGTVIPGASWVAPAIANLQSVADDLGSAAEPYVQGLQSEANKIADSPVGRFVSAIASGHFPSLGLTDNEEYGFIPVN
jgi:hypothetical protein